MNAGCSKVGTATAVTSGPGVYGGGTSGVGDGRSGAGGGLGPACTFCGSAAVRFVTPVLPLVGNGLGERPMVGGVRSPDGVPDGSADRVADGSSEGVADGLGEPVGVAEPVAPGFLPGPSPEPGPGPEQAPRARLRPSTTDTVTAPRARMPTTPPLVTSVATVTSSIRTYVRAGS